MNKISMFINENFTFQQQQRKEEWGSDEVYWRQSNDSKNLNEMKEISNNSSYECVLTVAHAFLEEE